MATCSIFEEDEIFVISEKGYTCGLVLESAEYASSDEDEDPNFDYERVKKGTIRVAWHPDGEEQVVQENSVVLADRSLMPGDVVRRLIQGQDSQRGYVLNTRVTCHLQILLPGARNKIMCNIPGTDLEPISPWDTEPGDVTYSCWVGKLEGVNEEVTLNFSDGACCKVAEDEFINELFRFEDICDTRSRESEFVVNNYYPGQQLRGSLGDLESADWIKTTAQNSPAMARTKKTKVVTVTVSNVDVKSVDVHWLCRGYAKAQDPLDKMEPPPRKLLKDQLGKLRKLDCFEACSVQIGDKAFYTIKDTNCIKSTPVTPQHTLIHYALDMQIDAAFPKLNTEPKDHAVDVEVNNMQNLQIHDAIPPQAEPCIDASKLQDNPQITSPVKSPEEKNVESSQTNGDEKPPCVENGVSDSAVIENGHPGEDQEEQDGDSGSDSDSSHQSSGSTSTSQQPKDKQTAGQPTLKTKLYSKKKKFRRSRKRGQYRPKSPEISAGSVVPVEVLYTSTLVDVIWQDGHEEQNISSTELFPIHHLDELEFFPGDMVVRDSEECTATDAPYGVVEGVSHADRTCLVRWMQPYTLGKTITPSAENTGTEEVSVYDIKDHPDYKFRPGHVVVRVGGYASDEVSEVAAGQVYELGTDGRLLIHWADGTQSYQYPQELYLIGDELAELGSELGSSSDESDDGSEAGSQVSWETEEEDEEIGTPGKDDGTKEGGSNVSLLTVEPGQKLELDQLLETARSTLQKLADTFKTNEDISPISLHCYREILRINRNCRDLQKMLEGDYFDDTQLLSTIGQIRTELKQEQASSMARQVLQLFEANCRLEAKTELGMDVTDQDRNIDLGSGDSSETNNLCPPFSCTAEGDQTEPSTADVDQRLSEQCIGDQTKQGKAKGDQMKQSIPEGDQTKQCAAEADRIFGEALLNIQSGKHSVADQQPEQADTTSSSERQSSLAKVLCETACRLLTEQITRVHADLEQKWQELKQSGRLKVLGEESDSESDDEAAALPNNATAALPIEEAAVTSSPCADSVKGKLHLSLTPPRPAADSAQCCPLTPQTPADVRAKLLCNIETGYVLEEHAPPSHRFYSAPHQPANMGAFQTALRKEMKLLRTSLPIGVHVKGFEDRMDLYTVMIEGPINTPYQDGLFFFDVQLPNDYPTSPPTVQYLSFCMDRLNPNLYEDGKVCVSLLGTWAGKGTEVWHSKSSLLQVLVSIQGLILVDEPYYNEAGYEKQKGTQQGHENSRMYNEMVICKLVQSLGRMMKQAPAVYELEVLDHLRQCSKRFIARLRYYMQQSDVSRSSEQPKELPSKDEKDSGTSVDSSSVTVDIKDDSSHLCEPLFPLLPASKGFCLTLSKNLSEFERALTSLGILSVQQKTG